MKNYNFLFKPLFFICSLVFACWLVLYIEKINPSDLGKYESLFDSPSEYSKNPNKQNVNMDKEHLKKICNDYKCGFIDSTKFEQEIESFFKSSEKITGP